MTKKGVTAKIVPNLKPNQNIIPKAVEVASKGQIQPQTASDNLCLVH